MSEREGCCRAAVDSDGHAHDHIEWYCDLVQAQAELAASLEVVKAAEAWADQFTNKVSGFPRRDALVAAVDTWRQTKGET